MTIATYAVGHLSRTAAKIYGHWYSDSDSAPMSGAEVWTWIGQGPTESAAPISESVHGPFGCFEEAAADCRLVHLGQPRLLS